MLAPRRYGPAFPVLARRRLVEPLSIEQIFPCVAVAGPPEHGAVLARAYGRLGLDVVADVPDDPAEPPGPGPTEAPRPAELIARAAAAGASAVHPGAAHPDHRAELASLSAEAGIVFVGCSPAAGMALSDPTGRRALANDLGLKVGPPGAVGDGAENDEEEAARLRRCRRVEIVVASDVAARTEALGTLESSYRAHPDDDQAILRESPCPHLRSIVDGDAVGGALEDAAIRIVTASGARGLVTLSFLLDMDDRIRWVGADLGYRLPLAPLEMVLGMDLTELELRCFSDAGLPDTLDTVHAYGAAVQATISAGEAQKDGIAELRVPPAPLGKLRVDHHRAVGEPIPAPGTPLLTLTAHGPVRHRALQLLDRVLAATRTNPVATNIEMLRGALNDESIRAGFYDVSSASRLATASS